MGRRKASPARSKRQNRWLPRFWRAVTSPAAGRIFAVAALLVLLFWLWPGITATAGQIAGSLGWGLVLVVVALAILAERLARRKFASFIRLYRWLGGLAFLLVVWGILGLLNLGGSFGRGLVTESLIIGVLRLLGLFLLGLVLVTPRASFRAFVRFVSWTVARLKTRRLRRPALKPPIEAPVGAAATPAPEAVPSLASAQAPPKAEKEPKAEPSQPSHDLRDIAKEVWKKYGQSSDLVTIDGWRLPPIDILDRVPEIEYSQADNVRRAKLIEEALGSYGVEGKVVQINTGPTVTQFGIEPGWDRKFKEVKAKDRDGNVVAKSEEVSKVRVKVDRITSLANDLALALAAPTIRIEAPVPGKSIVGIEVPNTTASVVSLRGVIETASFQKMESKSKLALALGKGAGGEAVSGDLSRMPHLLIAGATGSGKTVCLHTIICCLLAYNTPHDVRFIMVDPKRVELTPYNSIPHLAYPVIVDTNKALGALRWLNHEMDQRYQKLAAAGVRNIEGYNRNRHGRDRMPCIVLIVDELADLMMAGFDEVEQILCRLAQLARAVGIHLVVATQRPSVDVVTGLIKANFPTRISFAVTSQVDSRTILDGAGAEKLLGKGDMLYMPTEAAKPKRLQGCFVSDAETERLVYFWNSQHREETDQLKIEEIVLPTVEGREGADPLLDAARQMAQEHEQISTSYLQRRLHIGYPRAARLMEQLQQEGIKNVGGEAAGKEEGPLS